MRERALAAAVAADAALARGHPTGALHGVPMTIKDSFDTAGVISTGGTMGRAAFVAEQVYATVVARAESGGRDPARQDQHAGADGLNFETDNFVYGQTHNPYNWSALPAGAAAARSP